MGGHGKRIDAGLTERPSSAMVILPCPSCGRSVKVLGRVRRVLCACGRILLEVTPEKTTASAVKATR